MILGLSLWASAQDNTALQHALEDFLASGQTLEEFLPKLLNEGHDPQQVAQVVLQELPWEAPLVATLLARQDPSAAPFIASAVAAMALADPAPVAAAVATAVPALAPEIAVATGLGLPSRAPAVLEAVLSVTPGAAPELLTAMIRALPDQASPLTAQTLAFLAASSQAPLQATLLDTLGRQVPEATWAVAAALLATLDGLPQRVDALQRLLASANGSAPTLADEALVFAVSGGADLPTPGERLGVRERLRLPADGALTLLASSMVCHCAGPGELFWDASLQLQQGWCRCVGPQLQLAGPERRLLGRQADVLLAVADTGSGFIVLAGEVHDADGNPWPVGLHGHSTGAVPENFRRWRSQLGFDETRLGPLGEHSVWLAERLQPWLQPPAIVD